MFMACIVMALYSYGLHSYGPTYLWPYVHRIDGDDVAVGPAEVSGADLNSYGLYSYGPV